MSGAGQSSDPDETLIDLGGDSGFLAAIPDDDAPVASVPPPRPAGAPALPAPSGSTAQLPHDPLESPERRDRIVILGRRASGKTVYLARLYHHLFRGAGGVSMQALDGPSHLRCVKAMDELTRGQWPAATGETSALDLEIDFPGGKERLVALDYPGEVFRRAFVEETGGPDVEALLEHVDRAAAIVMLIDPASAISGAPGDLVEDDFGMLQALRRVRRSLRGHDVPIALVLTKVDANEHLIRAAGGLKPFVEKHYPALVRAAAGARVFGCAAVRMVVDPMGRRLPQIRSEPVGVVEPLLWCLTQMGRLRRGEAAESQRREMVQSMTVALRDADAAAARERRVLIIVWVSVTILLAVGALVTWYVLTDSKPPGG